MFEYQKSYRFFAQIAGGLEQLGAQELSELGAEEIDPAFRGLYFSADPAALYRINYCSRLLTRVLAPLVSFECPDDQMLYRIGRGIDWPLLFSATDRFSIFANVSRSHITHSQFATLRLKDAIVDAFRDATGQRPSVDRDNPDVWINLHIESDRATISLDTSGGSLHRRGYRKRTVEAPMQETVAAAILRYAEWHGQKPIYDPMCGSGTLLCEAMMAYCSIPAGYLRPRFGFERLPDFKPEVWQRIKNEADAQIHPLPDGLIAGSDISVQAVQATAANLRMLPNSEHIHLSVMDFNQIDHLNDRIIVCNPPYGIRLREIKKLDRFYKNLGDFLKQRCQGSTAFIYFGNRTMLKHIGLRPAWKKPLENGGLDGRLAKFDMY